MRIVRLVPGRPLPEGIGSDDIAVLTRTVDVDGERWPKGRRLDREDIVRLAGEGTDARPLTLLLLDPDDLHEDDAATRLAAVVAGPGTRSGEPSESRIDLIAEHDGVLRVRVAALERVDRSDAIEVFTRLDGQVVTAGDVVASIKVAPAVVAGSLVEGAVHAVGTHGLVQVLPYQRWTVGVIVKEAIHAPERARFEGTVRQRVEGLGSVVGPIHYVTDEPLAVAEALAGMATGAHVAELVLTAGCASTDPFDAFFLAIERLGGRIVRRGVPAHPGSMLWMGRVRRTTVLGLPTCGAYSRATAADLLIPWLMSGAPPTRATIARLGHGGILSRDQRFRFPAYASDLDAPEG